MVSEKSDRFTKKIPKHLDLMEAPNYTVEQFLNDCEGELSIFRNLDVMNKIASDIRNFDFQTIEQKLTDQELAKYTKLLPGSNYSTRKRMIINWLKENPAMMTIDPKLLYQRFFLYKREIGPMSRLLNPVQERPIEETKNQFNAIGKFSKQMFHQFKRDQETLRKAEAAKLAEQSRRLNRTVPVVSAKAQAVKQTEQSNTSRRVLTFIKQADGTLKLIDSS